MTPERLLEFADWLDKCLMHEESRIEITEFLRECAKAEPVATIIEPYEEEQIDGGTISVEEYLKLCDLPVGTKLYAHPPKQEQTVFEQLKTQMKNDADYAWSWHCNIAMVIYDAKLASHTIANLCAAQVMRILFDIEPAHDLPKQSPIDERAEFERWANENKGGEPLQLGGGGTYPNPFANAAFEAWQARAKLSAPVVPDEKRGLVVDDVEDRCEVDCAIAYANGWNDCRAAMLKGEK